MELAVKVAWRNLWRHKGKSLVIGFILWLGAVLMTVGNGMVSGMEAGLSANIVNLFTGDLVVISDEQEQNDVLINANGKSLKVLKDYAKAKTILEKQAWIQDYLPATAGYVLVFNSSSELGNAKLLGVDLARYQRFFPRSFRITEGKNFKAGERGVLISEELRKGMYNNMDFWLVPQGAKVQHATLPQYARKHPDTLEIRRDLVFMGNSESNTAVDVRVPVKAIIEYKALNGIWGSYGIIDLESFREAYNYVTSGSQAVKLSDQQKKLLQSKQTEDDIFSGDSLFDSNALTSQSISTDQLKTESARTSATDNLDAGSYNLIFLKKGANISAGVAQEKLNALFKENHLKLRVISWKDAVGSVGSMAVMIKAALNVFIMFIFFVAIIVIMNTLSMAALERVSELAMMRAIGARIWFVRKMFVYETGILAFFFGGIGIGVGILIVLLLSAAKIATPNEFLQLVYGGDTLNPLITLGDLILGIVELTVVVLAAVLYPLRLVGKIVPLDAIVRE